MDNKGDVEMLTGLIGFGYGPIVGLCEQGKKLFSYKRSRSFFF
jgi:hypothetical protein